MPDTCGNRLLQQSMATHVRDPSRPPPGCVPPPIASLYRHLVRNVFADAVDRAFPVLRAMLGDSGWERATDRFLVEHRCDSPHLYAVPEAFVVWLAEDERPAWMLELAHWEWLELDVGIAADDETPAFTGLSFAAGTRVVAYGHAVHRCRPGVVVDTALTCLAMWRDTAHRVRFLELDAAAFHLLKRIGDTPGIDRCGAVNDVPDIAAANAFIERMLACDLLVERSA